MLSYQEILDVIKKHDSIIIYRHIHPDFDAIGSQLGLKHLIMDNFPNKKVYCYGKETIENNPFVQEMDMHLINDDLIKNSLTILLDCSTIERADDDSFLKGKELLKIDHHLKSVYVTDNELVETTACAAAQIVADFAFSTGIKVSKKAASFLYCGILTDSVRLSIGTVTPKTFEICSKLVNCGINITEINRYAFDNDLKSWKIGVYFENKVTILDNFGYIIASKEDQDKFNITDAQAKDYVDLMGNIKEIDKYAVFAEKENGNYTCSLRSHGPVVVHIAQANGGGGHALACGIPEVTKETLKTIIQQMHEAK